jgi:hypothetical protein
MRGLRPVAEAIATERPARVGRAAIAVMSERMVAIFARRLMDDRYEQGNWNRTDPEYNQLKKLGDRNFRDPRSILVPDDGRI